MPLAPGTRLGNYDILAPLGKGGMGEVWRARDSRLGREVAIKVLPADVAQDADRLARFEREAKAVAALNHPNLVTLHSIEEADGVRFLTMELVDGQSLDRVVAPGGLPVARVLELTIPIADALAAAHQKGIVHRDLKPANVMVSREGRVKVLDFGLAKLADAGDAGPAGATQAPTMESPISAMGLVVGTAPYMAPEQLRGEPVDARTDLFALGVVIYELATGRRPFAGATAVEITSAILRDAPPPLSSVRADAPKDLERILARCLEKDPERRVQTAKDVRNELELLHRATGAAPAYAAPAAAAPAPPPAADEAPTIAVLPFANRSADPADEYFSDGLADELLSVLVKIRGLRVAARTSSGTFKGKTVTIEEVGRALNVASVLEGSVRKAGNRVRISVQLVKVKDGASLWSETYDRTLDDIFAVQDDIAQSVVKELRTTLLGQAADSDASGEAKAEVAAAAAGRGGNPEAHRLYLQGAYFIERGTLDDTAKGIGYLREALALDPVHAQAWAALARAYAFEVAFGWMDVAEGQRLVRAALEKALTLAPDMAEAKLLQAQVQAYYDHDWKGADTTMRRAIELAPGSAHVLTGAGQIAQNRRHFEEAEQYLLRALEADPLSPRAYSQIGYLYRCTGRISEAERAYRKSLELSPQRITAHHILAEMLSKRGEHAAALAEVQLEPAPWARLTGLANVHFRAGRRAEADAALAELKAKHANDSGFQIAALHADRGDLDASFQWLERAFDDGDQGLALLYCEPMFRPLHDDPRWLPLLRKLGLVD